MRTFRDFFQHVFNPLHMFCRLRRVGVTPAAARNLCRIYERGIYRFLT